MNRFSTVIAWVAVAVVALFVAMNWGTMLQPATLNFGVGQLVAPLGLVMLGIALVLLALFFIVYLRSQIAALLEARKLLKEIQRVQSVADKSEASRIDNLYTMIATEFRLMNERISHLAVISPAPAPIEPERRTLTQLISRREQP